MDTASSFTVVVDSIVDQVKPIIAGKGPELQGAVLAMLTAMWLSGHHPKVVRETLLQMQMSMIRQLADALEDEAKHEQGNGR